MIRIKLIKINFKVDRSHFSKQFKQRNLLLALKLRNLEIKNLWYEYY